MKKNIIYALLLGITLLSACKKDENMVNTTKAPELKYEVITSAGNWFGEWDDANGKRAALAGSPLNKTGWTYTFTPASLPFQMVCHATADCGGCQGTSTAPDVTVNLYIDGKKVKTETNNYAKGVTTAVFEVK